MPDKRKRRTLQRNVFLVLLLIITSGIVYAAVFFIEQATFSVTDLEAGDVSGQDILAPYAIVYESDILTEQMRESAVREVTAKYTPADTNVARKQLEKLRLAMAYITSVRADNYASMDEKLADLAALQDVQISQDTALGILTLNDPRWQTIQQEAIVVLEQVMRNTIRDSQLDFYRRNATNLVSLSIPEEQAAIVAELAAAFVTPNSLYSDSLTKAAEQQAYESVSPVTVSYAAGETILRRGEVVSSVDIEALQQLGLAEKETRWQDYASSGILVLISSFLVIIFFRRNPKLLESLPSLLIIALLFVIYLIAARLVLPIHPLTPYVYPMAAYALILAGLFGAEPALVTVIPLIILATYGYGNAYELILYYGISSIFGVLIPRQEQRITGYIWVGLSVAVTGAVVVLTYQILESETTGLSLLILFAIAILNGMIAAGFTVLMQYVLAPILGQTTPLQLLELSRPDHPLLEYLLRNAPGTYQHSLQVANLAEQAAERIDADSLLTRVGALYHDIGKTQNPQFFIENQVPGQLDTHDNIPPENAAGIIKHHVVEGVELASEYKLPRRIQDFITEHHGTFKTRYQWTQAIKAVGGDKSLLDEDIFSYPGPKPQSRETALVMLADGSEARVRAKRPTNESDLRKIIKDTVDSCLEEGQLEETPLTLKELSIIVDSFTATLKGIYHPRVEYPTLDVPTRPVPDLSVEDLDQVEKPETPLDIPAQESRSNHGYR
jgi:putative nucleotidyltransferase with HDIG domain